MPQPTPKSPYIPPMSQPTPKSNPQIQIQIQILPILPHDLPALALLESQVFLHDPFSITAFGPKKDTAENLAIRVRGLEKTLVESVSGKGERKRTVNFKAIVGDQNAGVGGIVGWGSWSFVAVGEAVKEGEKTGGIEALKSEGKGAKNNSEKKEETLNDNRGWGITANVKFCHDVFLVADQWMLDAAKGRDYAKLNALLIHPSYQRKGIGTLMLGEGLREVDELKLQCVLGASPGGKGLYERFGFEEVGRMELSLEGYENGEGMGGRSMVLCGGLLGGRDTEGEGGRGGERV